MNTWKINLVLFCLLLTRAAFVVGQVGQQRQTSGVIVIQGATLINGTGGPSIRNGSIVVDGGRIRDIGPRNEVRVPGNAQIVDAVGSVDDREVLLGLWELVWAGLATNDTLAPLRAWLPGGPGPAVRPGPAEAIGARRCRPGWARPPRPAGGASFRSGRRTRPSDSTRWPGSSWPATAC